MLDGFTPRQMECLALLSEGLENKEIAEQMGIEMSSVCKMIKDMYDQAGLEGRKNSVKRLRLALIYWRHIAGV